MGNSGIVLVHAADALYACGRLSIEQCIAKALSTLAVKHGWEEIEVAKSLHAKTARERDYIAALATLYAHPEKKDEKREQKYLKEMGGLYRRYPDDHEAAAFYAFALKDSDRDDDPTHAKRKEAAAILESLFLLEPNHPGVVHYLIHTYDYPGMAELGLPAARCYAKIAPAAPHALHMPSHIFARLGIPVKVNIDSGGKPNGVPERR